MKYLARTFFAYHYSRYGFRRAADIYTFAHVGYEEEIDSVRAYVETLASYDAAAFYCAEAYGYVFKDGVEIGDVYVYDEALQVILIAALTFLTRLGGVPDLPWVPGYQ